MKQMVHGIILWLIKDKRMEWIQQADAFCLVFSLSEPASFEAVKPYFSMILEFKEKERIPIILVGNKSDQRHLVSQEG